MILSREQTLKQFDDADALYEVARLITLIDAFEIVQVEFHEETPPVRFIVSRYVDAGYMDDVGFNRNNLIESEQFDNAADARQNLIERLMRTNIDANRA